VTEGGGEEGERERESALGPVRNPVLQHRVCLFSLVGTREEPGGTSHRVRLFSLVPVPLVWESKK